MDLGPGAPRLVLVGYSKGTPDVLEAIVNYPEIRPRVAAVVSVAGAVGGSPLANDAEQYQADLLRHFPGATCDSGDGGGVASLRPGVRRAWLAQNPLPTSVPTYSVVTLPQPERISSILRCSAEKLSMIDGRNDSQVIFYDQVIPGSTLVGYVNADHWAIAVPIARKSRNDRVAVRHRERLSARGVSGSGAAFCRGRSRRQRQVGRDDDAPTMLSHCDRSRRAGLLRTAIHAVAVAILGLAGMAGPASAWVYPEHRDIAVLAVEQLDPDRRALFDSFWQEARAGNEPRLCEQAADASQGLAPACIDWAALPAIAGDHSCSSKNMLDNVVHSDWILQVADVAAQLKVDLGRIAVTAPPELNPGDRDLVGDTRRIIEDQALRAARQNALRTADTRMQRADPEYATRAGSSNAHFLLPRPRTDITGKEYAELTLSPGSEINAVGVYAWFHLSALQKATRLATEQLAPSQRQALARAMLADEAFALHFLEDTFAAGHVAGSWGDVSQRKGTHDYYNEAGLEVFTWDGRSIVLMGDAHMRPEDAERTAAAVRMSLEQLIDHASGRDRAIAGSVHARGAGRARRVRRVPE